MREEIYFEDTMYVFESDEVIGKVKISMFCREEWLNYYYKAYDECPVCEIWFCEDHLNVELCDSCYNKAVDKRIKESEQ